MQAPHLVIKKRAFARKHTVAWLYISFCILSIIDSNVLLEASCNIISLINMFPPTAHPQAVGLLAL